MTSEKRRAILIAAHGSRSGSNESAAETQARILREKGFKNVYHGFKGYSEPYIKNVVTEVAKEGFDELIAVLLFIARGHYTDVVVPRHLGLPDRASEGTVDVGGKRMRIRVADAFGTDPLMADIVIKRAREQYGGRGRPGILLIGHGSKGPENQEMVRTNAERVGRTCPNVYTAFNEFNGPTVEDALDSMERDGVEEVVAVPMFVSSGGHTEEDLPGKLGLRDGAMTGETVVNGRSMAVSYGAPVGTDPMVADILESRIRSMM